jgi:rubredoxin
MKRYKCTVCGHVYDPAVGDPDGGIAPGTPFGDIPETWRCPVCQVTQEDYVPMED